MVCSLAEAQRAGVADRAVFVWSGAEATDVRFPTARPDPDVRRPSPPPAGRLAAASSAAGGGGAGGDRGGPDRSGSVGIDDIEVLDLYSCFPSAVELAAAALGIAPDDRAASPSPAACPTSAGRATTTRPTPSPPSPTSCAILRGGSPPGAEPRDAGTGARLGWPPVSAGSSPSTPSASTERPRPRRVPPGGHRRRPRPRSTPSAVEVALEVAEPTPATVVAATVVRDDAGCAGPAHR